MRSGTVADVAQAVRSAATAYVPRSFAGTSVPARAELHLMNRLGCGYSRSTFRQLRSDGGADAWLTRQLTPDSIAEAPIVAQIDSWFPQRASSPQTLWNRHITKQEESWEVGVGLGNWTMLRKMYSRRTVLENLVDFWSHHFHVPAFGDQCWVQRYEYDSMLRRHALGRFDQMLEAVTLHPAMLIYLDNYRSERNAPNENHGRELLELHTVGPDSTYTEPMVYDSAVILSGFSVDAGDSWVGRYDSSQHTMGPVRVLGFSDDNTQADGRTMAKQYLQYLAHHPSTARTIARKMALRFVSDTPSDSLISHLAGVFLDSGTDIKATLEALVATEDFKASYGGKVRTPIEDLVSTTRVLGITPSRPTTTTSFGHAIAYAHGGDRVYSWPRPDGAPLTNDVWCSASRMLQSFTMHWNLAGGYYPSRDVQYRTTQSWLPQSRLRFDRYVDHLSRTLLGCVSTPLTLQVACQATDYAPGEVVTASHPLATWMLPRLVAALLDSPFHMTH